MASAVAVAAAAAEMAEAATAAVASAVAVDTVAAASVAAWRKLVLKKFYESIIEFLLNFLYGFLLFTINQTQRIRIITGCRLETGSVIVNVIRSVIRSVTAVCV